MENSTVLESAWNFLTGLTGKLMSSKLLSSVCNAPQYHKSTFPCQLQCSQWDHNFSYTGFLSLLTTGLNDALLVLVLTLWRFAAYTFMENSLTCMGKENYSFQYRRWVATGIPSSLSASHHAISASLQETHLLLEMYLLMTIYFSWFAFLPQFSPQVIPAFQWLWHAKVFGFQFKWPSIKHHGVPTVCLGMWKPG